MNVEDKFDDDPADAYPLDLELDDYALLAIGGIFFSTYKPQGQDESSSVASPPVTTTTNPSTTHPLLNQQGQHESFFRNVTTTTSNDSHQSFYNPPPFKTLTSIFNNYPIIT